MTPICIDDFGNEVYRCHWTDLPVSVAEMVITGGFMPGVKARYFSHPDHKEAKKRSYEAFADLSERNCNTCKNLIREKTTKDAAGFLYGKCAINSDHPKIYGMIGNVMKFHPDDPMHMKCYESRFA